MIDNIGILHFCYKRKQEACFPKTNKICRILKCESFMNCLK